VSPTRALRDAAALVERTVVAATMQHLVQGRLGGHGSAAGEDVVMDDNDANAPQRARRDRVVVDTAGTVAELDRDPGCGFVLAGVTKSTSAADVLQQVLAQAPRSVNARLVGTRLVSRHGARGVFAVSCGSKGDADQLRDAMAQHVATLGGGGTGLGHVVRQYIPAGEWRARGANTAPELQHVRRLLSEANGARVIGTEALLAASRVSEVLMTAYTARGGPESWARTDVTFAVAAVLDAAVGTAARKLLPEDENMVAPVFEAPPRPTEPRAPRAANTAAGRSASVGVGSRAAPALGPRLADPAASREVQSVAHQDDGASEGWVTVQHQGTGKHFKVQPNKLARAIQGHAAGVGQKLLVAGKAARKQAVSASRGSGPVRFTTAQLQFGTASPDRVETVMSPTPVNVLQRAVQKASATTKPTADVAGIPMPGERVVSALDTPEVDTEASGGREVLGRPLQRPPAVPEHERSREAPAASSSMDTSGTDSGDSEAQRRVGRLKRSHPKRDDRGAQAAARSPSVRRRHSEPPALDRSSDSSGGDDELLQDI
jgi:hypothetical protein